MLASFLPLSRAQPLLHSLNTLTTRAPDFQSLHPLVFLPSLKVQSGPTLRSFTNFYRRGQCLPGILQLESRKSTAGLQRSKVLNCAHPSTCSWEPEGIALPTLTPWIWCFGRMEEALLPHFFFFLVACPYIPLPAAKKGWLSVHSQWSRCFCTARAGTPSYPPPNPHSCL